MNTQIRTGLFESNSSSTHVYSVYFNDHAKIEFKPIIENVIEIPSSAPTSESWQDKVRMLVGYLHLKERFTEITIVLRLLSDFTQSEVKINLDELKAKQERYSKWGDVTIEDYFSSYINSDYGMSVKEIEQVMDRILSSDKDILRFICSTGWLDFESYYNG